MLVENLIEETIKLQRFRAKAEKLCHTFNWKVTPPEEAR